MPFAAPLASLCRFHIKHPEFNKWMSRKDARPNLCQTNNSIYGEGIAVRATDREHHSHRAPELHLESWNPGPTVWVFNAHLNATGLNFQNRNLETSMIHKELQTSRGVLESKSQLCFLCQ